MTIVKGVHHADRAERLLQVTAGLEVFDVPVAIYVATNDGVIVRANERACEMLRLQPGDQRSIVDYYTDPSRRDELAHILLESERSGQRLDRVHISLTVSGLEKMFRKS